MDREEERHDPPGHSPKPGSPGPGAPTRRLLRELLTGTTPFALLRRRTPGHDQGVVELLTGPVTEVARLADLPVPERALALVPFRQLRERGFEVTDDATPLSVLVPDETWELPLGEVAAALPEREITVHGGGFDVDDEGYRRIVAEVVEREIGAGQGANFVIKRTFTGHIPGFGRAEALALFRRLLLAERGAYWTFVVHTGRRVLVGASPEVHVRMSGGTVVMNPISGTYRYPPGGPSVAGLLSFLADRKEAEELSMVVDEELKMMCAVGDQGGVVVGPRLREMAHLAHIEYELRGRSSLDVREVLRETMFAATVTGSPVENACRVIARREHGGRGYYGGALALLGRDAGGAQTLDSPILIRTADIRTADGRLRVPVGATLVRGSDPAGETAETHAKAAAVLTALGVRNGPAGGAGPRPRLAGDPRVAAALAGRRALLAPFWLRMRTAREGATGPAGEAGPGILVVDGEDTFTAMLAHVLRATGSGVTVARYDAPGTAERALAHAGPVVLGPGPGDPNDAADPRMRALRSLAAALLGGHPHGVLGVCLGHELLAAELDLPVVRREQPRQGAQERIDFFGGTETVGFYSSYAARCDAAARRALAARGVELSLDAATGEVHALRGPGFAGVQFHPESVLTLDAPRLLGGLLGHLRRTAAGAAGAAAPAPGGGRPE
ncbi:anthranilate synthase family protein [Streptomyces hoynatensis]|uniref:anthranilate synthase n=1 Tax=Streptomyces hoynatensis TaxID=1141874 RepID=A0A3A9Z4F8_9ACTN|nr:anthranilate synthase family protein [Streptomyces hoynatensis]RKN42276.1 phenazine-specific anthranilate synthase component I [Streptomyces hoynatensis]